MISAIRRNACLNWAVENIAPRGRPERSNAAHSDQCPFISGTGRIQTGVPTALTASLVAIRSPSRSPRANAAGELCPFSVTIVIRPFGTIRLEGLRQRAAAAVDEDEVQLVDMPGEAVEGGGFRADHAEQHVSGSRLPGRKRVAPAPAD